MTTDCNEDNSFTQEERDSKDKVLQSFACVQATTTAAQKYESVVAPSVAITAVPLVLVAAHYQEDCREVSEGGHDHYHDHGI